MILSVSRRTDIPMRYSDWFIERVKKWICVCKKSRKQKICKKGYYQSR